MNILFPQTDEAWNPYIGVQGIASIDPLTLASAALRAALIDKAIRQAESISDVLQRRDMTRFPAVVQSLDLETGGLATNRLDNMLCALKRFLTEPHHADVREKLSAALRPMDSWVRGRYSVTSPALLVIQAILYSHCEWSREHLFEAYSARRAFEELDILGFPEQDKSFIAALIAHQTLLRTSWSTDKKRDPKEVLAFYRDDDGKVKFVGENGDEEGKAELMADRSVGQALAKTLFRFLPIQTSQPSSPDSQQETYSQQAAVVDNQQETIPLRRRQLAAALILHSLCLSCRHSHIESGMLKELKVQALGFLDHILAAGSTKKLYQYCLAFFQYGRHVYQAQSDTDKTTLLDDAKNIIIEHFKGQNSLTNVSLCFQRVSTHRVWLGVTQVDSPDLDLEKQPNPQDIHRISEIWDLVERTVGSVWKLSLKPEIYFLKALGLDSSDQEFKNLLVSWLKSETKTCEVLSELLKKIQQGSQRLPRDNYYPAPLVGQVLRQMRDARPELFTPLRIITRSAVTPAAMPSVGDTSFTVWLPKIVPIDSDKIVDPNAVVVWTGNSIDPNLLIARYVASMIIGRAVSFAPREILLDYYSEDTRHKWGKIIDRALYENGGPAMRTYISQLGCEPTAFRSLEVIETLHVSVSQKERQAVIQNRYILGIDIGGTSIKMLRFRVGDLNNSSEGEQIPLKRDNDLSLISVKGKNPKEVAEVAEVIENIVGSCESNPFENCVAVGVSLPCPVSSQQPRVPQAPTYSLHSLFNTQKDITKANPLDFHKLDFAKAITERYPTIKIVSVLNDGNADIRDGEDDLTISTHEGTTVVLKAGTGVAFAVYHDKKPVELKAETAKAPLNLCAKPQLKIPDERFQQGTIREFCSKDGLKRLTCNVLFDEVKHKNFFDNPGELIGPILTKALAGEKIDFGYSGGEMQVPLEPNAATDFNSMLEIFKINKNSDELKKIYRRAMDIGRQRRISKVKKKIDEWQKNQDIELADFENETKDWGKDIGQDTFDQFSDLQMFALGCAWILGGWLADAIAQVVDIYGAREIRLAGGPLSGAMGLLVAASAEKALETAYSFDLDVVSDPQRIDYMTSHGQPLALHRIREVKRLRLVYPSEDSGIGGPRGAAKAALDAWIKYEKQDELRRCRDWVNEKFNRGDSFNAKKLKKVAAQDKPISLISDTEVELMLAKEVSALGLTRSPGGKFRKL